MRHYRLQDESRQAYHMQHLSISQGRDSLYKSSSLSAGSAWARNNIQVLLNEPGAECHLDGLYTVGQQQLNDFHLDIRHAVPHCTSHANFKGLIHGKGRGVFDGGIYVAKDAQQTDAHLSNKNLMLCRDAEIDTKPQLEIYADDVKCSHGTTVGQIDPEQIFYLRSRGIAEIEARKMLSMGFAREALQGIEIDSVQQYADRYISTMLSQNMGTDNGNL
jgi:Fe-S cluster assembly protein SufD